MSDYCYLKDKDNDLGLTPVLGDDMVMAILAIARRYGIRITDKMILGEIFNKPGRVKRRKNNKGSKKI